MFQGDIHWWWALVSAAGGALLATAAFSGQIPSGATPVPGVARNTILYLPHIMLLFGVFADIFTLSGVYSEATFFALMALLWNVVSQSFFAFVTDMAKPAGISAADARTQGLVGPLRSTGQFGGGSADEGDIEGLPDYMKGAGPQSLVVTSSIFWYYLADLFANRTWQDAMIALVAWVLFSAAQVVTIKAPFTRSAIGIAVGTLSGGLSFLVWQALVPSRVPSAARSSTRSLASLTKAADGSYIDPLSGITYIDVGGIAVPKDKLSDSMNTKAASVGTCPAGTTNAV